MNHVRQILVFVFVIVLSSSVSFAKTVDADADTNENSKLEKILAEADKSFYAEKYAKAIALYESAAAVDPESADIQLSLGMAYDSHLLFDKAIAAYRKALELNHDEKHTVYNNIGVSYAKQRQYDKAIPEFLAAIKAVPDYALAYYNLGRAYVTQGKKDLARAQHQKTPQTQ